MVDLRTVREPAQAYVMLSRVQELNQLYILENLPVDKLKASEVALREVNRLNMISINQNLPEWYNPTSNCLKIVFLNTRSLRKHFSDIRCNWQICSSDLLCISETWLISDAHDQFKLPGYESVHFVISGRGKGLATYTREPFAHEKDVNSSHHQITKVVSSRLDVISVYRSSSSPMKDIFDMLKPMIDNTKTTLIGGDMNTCVLKNSANPLTKRLEGLGFVQLVNQATHILGGALDHVYVRHPDGSVPRFWSKINIYPLSVYWSDHDAVMVSVWQNDE